jgi:hypothetical protein
MALVAGCDNAGRKIARNTVIPPPKEPVFEPIDSPGMQYLPRQQEAQGWQLEEDPLVVLASRLPSYLGQDAQHFRDYGVVDVTVGKYKAVSGPGFATVEIFRFPDFVKAFGAYSTRKVEGTQYLPIPNEAFVRSHSIHVWRGPFYIRVGGGGDPQGLGGLQRLAAFTAEKMPPAPGKPAVFSFLPDKGRVPNSERYSAEATLGQHFLANSFQATYLAETGPAEAVVLPAANRDVAAKVLDAYRNLFVRNGKLLDPIPNLGEDNFTAEDKYLGRVVAFRLDRFVVVFSGYIDRQKLVDLAAGTDQRILGTIRKQLVSADKAADASNSTPKSDNAPPWMH